jgi:phosphoglycolate phosphatase
MTSALTGLVAFDLDGTLVDSAGDLASAASALTGERGGRALSCDQVVAMVGEGAAVLVRRALTAAGLDPDTAGATARFLELYDARMLETTVLYPGIRLVLDALDPLLPLAVVTNKPEPAARRMVEALGLSRYFVEVIGAEGVFPRKPDPAGLRSLEVHAGGGPLVLVGDSPVDRQTAERAGAAFVLAGYGFGATGPAEALATPYVAGVPSDLPRVIGEALRLGRMTA